MFILEVRNINPIVSETVHVAVISRDLFCMEEYVFPMNCTGEFIYFDFVMNKSTASR